MSDEPRIDPERLAALLDKRLDADARARLIGELAESDADTELLADAAAGVAGADASERPRGIRMLGMRPFMLAAAAVLVIALPVAYTQLRDRGDVSVYGRLYADAGGTIPNDWNTTPWPATRGGAIGPTSQVVSARLGMRFTELIVAAASNLGQVSVIAIDAALLAESQPGGAALASVFRDVAAAAPGAALDAALEHALDAAREFLDADHLALGAWTEGARLAGARQDLSYFRSRATKRLLARARAATISPDAARFVQDIVAATADRGAVVWDGVAAAAHGLALTLTQ